MMRPDERDAIRKKRGLRKRDRKRAERMYALARLMRQPDGSRNSAVR